jgi:exonuclease VII small subunit
VVLLAFLAGLGLVIVATVVCVVRGVRLWRQLKRTSGTLGAELATFEARTARTETLLAQTERKSAELEAALQRLRVSRAQLQVLRDAVESAQARVRWIRALLPI